jgi:peptidoglycan/LPS O-acetylase OafA/YrhL
MKIKVFSGLISAKMRNVQHGRAILLGAIFVLLICCIAFFTVSHLNFPGELHFVPGNLYVLYIYGTVMDRAGKYFH